MEAIHEARGPIGPPGIEPVPNVPPFPYITFGGPLRQRVEDTNRSTGSPRMTERAANVVEAGARDGRLASALEIKDRPSIASPLGQDLGDLEPLRSSTVMNSLLSADRPAGNGVLLQRGRHP